MRQNRDTNKALIVVDYENEWLDKESEYHVGSISNKIAKLNELIKACREKGVPIFFTQHIEPQPSKAFAKGTKNTEIIKEVDFQKNKDILVTKNRISSFYKTILEEKLKELNTKELLVTGILTNLCVRSLTEGAYDRDYKITIVTDTCAAFSEETHNFTIKDLKETRPEIEFKTAREIIQSMVTK